MSNIPPISAAERITDRFLARDDEGRTYLILEYQRIVFRRAFDRQIVTYEGRKRLALTDGRVVRAIGNGAYRLTGTEETLWRVNDAADTLV